MISTVPHINFAIFYAERLHQLKPSNNGWMQIIHDSKFSFIGWEMLPKDCDDPLHGVVDSNLIDIYGLVLY